MYDLTTSEVVDSMAIPVNDTEAGRLLIILVNIPEHMDLVECRAANLSPKGLCILNTGHSIAVLGSTDGPACLGDPDPFARRHLVDDIADLVDGCPKSVSCCLNGASLEVRIGVHTNKIRSCDHLCVGRINPMPKLAQM